MSPKLGKPENLKTRTVTVRPVEKPRKPQVLHAELQELAAGRGRAYTVKRGRGRPPRTDNPERLLLKIPGELKRWLEHQAIDERRTMSEIIAELLEGYRERKGTL